MNLSNFINRIKQLLLETKKEFINIHKEDKDPVKILKDFILPMVIINALASFLGDIFFGPASFKIGSGIVLQNVLLIAVVQLVAIYISAYLMNELLPLFQVKKNFNASFRLIAYSFTPIFITTIVAGLLPNFGTVINFFGFYAIVIIWIGADILLPVGREKKQLFVPVVVVLTGLNYLAVRGILGILFSI